MTNSSPHSKGRVLVMHTALRPPLDADTWIQALIMRHLDRERHEVHVAGATGPAKRPHANGPGDAGHSGMILGQDYPPGSSSTDA